MPAPDIKLYSYALSPYAAKVHCFLVFKRLPFNTVYVSPLKAREELPVGRLVPVLSVNGESRNDSTPIGLWLDELFPDEPRLLPEQANDRERLLEIDRWVSQSLVPLTFRVMLAYKEPLSTHIRNRRRGARALDYTVPGGLPVLLRLFYPFLVQRVGFVRRLLQSTDTSIDNRQLQEQTYAQLKNHLQSGPYLGGVDGAGLADLSAFAQLALPYLAGYDGADLFLREPAIAQWFKRVSASLPDTQPLLPELLIERPLASIA